MFWVFLTSMIISGMSSYLGLVTKKKWIRIVAGIVTGISFPLTLLSAAMAT